VFKGFKVQVGGTEARNFADTKLHLSANHEPLPVTLTPIELKAVAKNEAVAVEEVADPIASVDFVLNWKPSPTGKTHD
jgi:hypothetical protein